VGAARNSSPSRFNFNNLSVLFHDGDINAFLNSIKFAFISQRFCLLVGYPMHRHRARSSRHAEHPTLMVILPFWTSLLPAGLCLDRPLKANGVINNVLLGSGSGRVITIPLTMLYTHFARVGIVYSYRAVSFCLCTPHGENGTGNCRAGRGGLGCRPGSVLKHSLRCAQRILAGVHAGVHPGVGEFVIRGVLGGPKALMIDACCGMISFSKPRCPFARVVAILLLLSFCALHIQRHGSTRCAAVTFRAPSV